MGFRASRNISVITGEQVLGNLNLGPLAEKSSAEVQRALSTHRKSNHKELDKITINSYFDQFDNFANRLHIRCYRMETAR